MSKVEDLQAELEILKSLLDHEYFLVRSEKKKIVLIEDKIIEYKEKILRTAEDLRITKNSLVPSEE